MEKKGTDFGTLAKFILWTLAVLAVILLVNAVRKGIMGAAEAL